MKLFLIVFFLSCTKSLNEISYFDKGINDDLIKAIKNNNEEGVEKLLKSGADANYRVPRGETPLLIAANRASLKIIKMLVDRGAKINNKDSLGYFPLYSA